MIFGSTFAASRFPSWFGILWDVFGVPPEPRSCVGITPVSMASLQVHPLLPETPVFPGFHHIRCVWCVVNVQSFSHIQLFVTPWTVARQAPLSMEFSRQEYWSGLPCPPPGDLPNPGIKLMSLVSLALAGGFFITVPHRKPSEIRYIFYLKKRKFSNNPEK